jgi:beta-N-acetylhexosaminidase
MGEPSIGQLFLMGFPGTELSQDARRLIQHESLGGAILFSRNIESLEQVVELNSEIIALGTEAFPTLISVDQEGGRVARLRGICTDIPDMRSVGHASAENADLPYRVGAMMARELSCLGFHLNFAPVLDVDTNPLNPVIGERSFGSDPSEVSKLGVQFIRGMQQAGVAACGKHFPGHGDTDTDSHFALPRIPHDLHRLETVELPPFKAAADAQVASIMTAHVMFPALDPDHPATLSPAILHKILRERFRYEGVIVSDDLEMQALADHFSVEEMVVQGLLAGIDLFLICHRAEWIERGLEAVRKALDSGRLPLSRVEEACHRIQLMKARFLGKVAKPDLQEARQIIGCHPHRALVAQIPKMHEDQNQSARESSPVDQY